jgi:hypothetical protein
MAEGVSKIGQMSRRHGIRQMSFRDLNASTVRSQSTASNSVEVRASPLCAIESGYQSRLRGTDRGRGDPEPGARGA